MARRGNNEGSIYKNTDGRWVAAVDLGRDERGRRRRRRFYAATRGAAKDLLTQAMHSQSEGTLRGGRDATLGAFLTRWLGEISVRESTRDHYSKYVRLHITPAIGRIPLAKLTAQDVDELLRAKLRTLAPQSVDHIRAVLRNALGRAMKFGLVTRNVAELTDAPAVPEYEARYLAVDEAHRLLAAARGDRLEALYTVALSLGLRQGEALGLRWEDVDVEARTLHVRRSLQRIRGAGLQLLEPKTKRSRRSLPIPDAVLRALRAHRTSQLEERLIAGAAWVDSGLVFTTLEGRPLSASHVVSGSFRRIVRTAGLEGRLRFHDLRVSAATLLLAQGVPQRVVMEILGHSTTRMTDHYTKVVPQLMRDAAAAMDRALGS